MRPILVSLLCLPALIAAIPAQAGEHASCRQERRTIRDLEARNDYLRRTGPGDQKPLAEIDRQIAESQYRPVRAPGETERLWRERRDAIAQQGDARILGSFIDANNAEIARARVRMKDHRCKARGPIAPPPPEEPAPPPRPLPWQKDDAPLPPPPAPSAETGDPGE